MIDSRQWRRQGCCVWAAAMVVGLCGAATATSSQPDGDLDPLSVAASRSMMEIDDNLCAFEPRDQLCAGMPKDVSDFNASLVYTLIERNAQNPFDVFSWQSFVALNWPVDSAGNPRQASKPGDIDSTTLVRWQTYETPDSMFGLNATGRCREPGKSKAEETLLVRDFVQSSGDPLIDRYGNYVVFDVRINSEMATYIRDNQLNTFNGQALFNAGGGQIDFPRGVYANPVTRIGGRDGALVIKSAWRILDPDTETEPGRFFTRSGRIEVDGPRSSDGRPRCIDAVLGLVGFHIMRRTTAGNGGEWIWSTFEHIDNAPFAGNARGPNRIFDTPLFDNGCSPPRSDPDSGQVFSFYRAGHSGSRTNVAPSVNGAWKWRKSPPFAGNTLPAQVSRCWQPARSTVEVNRLWRKQLADTVWTNYALSTTQWKGAPVGTLFPNGEVPRYLTNSTMETFIQGDSSGSCLGCHAAATTAAGQPANFSFLLGRVLTVRNYRDGLQSDDSIRN